MHKWTSYEEKAFDFGTFISSSLAELAVENIAIQSTVMLEENLNQLKVRFFLITCLIIAQISKDICSSTAASILNDIPTNEKVVVLVLESIFLFETFCHSVY